MLLYHDAVKGPDEVWYDWDWLLWKQRCQSVLRLLVNNGLDVLCEVFLDGKSSITEGYIRPISLADKSEPCKWTSRDLIAATDDGMDIVEYFVQHQLLDDPDDSHPANIPPFTGKTRVQILSTLLAMNPHDEICIHSRPRFMD